MKINDIFALVPFGFGVGFILETCLSLLGYGIRKAISLFNIRS